MKYNEWRDELKNNLLSVTDAERKRVLDYYAEAYADRREAGFTEREIIEDFGAPYDAAQRILAENADEYYHDFDRRESRKDYHERPDKSKSREDYTWVFVLLCIIFAAPLFGVVMAMVGVTIGLCVAPFSVLISGIGGVIAGIATMLTNPAAGAFALAGGLVVLGVGIILFPLFFKLVKLMWKLFNMFFRWIRRLFSGKDKERA